MKTIKKVTIFTIALIFSLLINTYVNAATTTVSNEQDLRIAIENATNGDVIELSSNILLTSPIEITGKSITINGNGHTVTRIDTNWTPNGSNGSLITAGADGTVLTFTNMELNHLMVLM